MKQRAFGNNIICTDADLGDVTTDAGIVIKSNTKESELKILRIKMEI